jgi:ATP-dependent DNA helicase DinG
MRDRAAEAQVIVVNHHLLCADASVREGGFGAVIPDCDLAVIDEAHQLEDIVTQYFGVTLGAHRVEQFVRDVQHAAGLLPPERRREAAALDASAADVLQACRRLFDTARVELIHQGSGDRLTHTPAVAQRLEDTGVMAREALDRTIGRLADGGGGDDPSDLGSLTTRALAMQDDLRVLLAADDPSFVHYIEGRGRGATLKAAPIDVSHIVRSVIIGDRQATVLTSATLAVDGAFDYASARLGVPDATTLRLPSEFDFASQALLFLPDGMPDPRTPDFNRAATGVVAEILNRTSGRAFVLFTSYAAMREVHAGLEGRIEWPLFVQGTAPRTVLLRNFRATPNAVLLATASFWQGVDVAGEALSCVIIDRLPFASPADPLVAARIAAIENRGGHPFHEYQVPLATLVLLQGIGRLIRSRADRGILAILDPRLLRMAYGRRFLASFPPAPVTSDLAAVERFFETGPGVN